MSRFSSETLNLSIGSEVKFTLTEGIYYTTDVRSEPYTLYIPDYYTTDLTSVPWWLQWKVPKFGSHNLASIPHDYLLDNRDLFDYSRREIDKIYCEALIDRNVDEERINILYKAVRFHSWRVEERFL